jgi:hypothetical protein
LLFAATQLCRSVCDAVAQAHRLKEVARPLATFGFRSTEFDKRKRDVGTCRQGVEEMKMLKNDSDVIESVAGPGPIRKRTQIGPIERHRPHCRRIEASQQMQQCRFTTPTRSRTADDLAAFDL